MVLRAVQERMGFIGKIVVGIIGMAWNVATFLAVPVLVAEDVSPVDAVKRSMSLLKKTWGEQLMGGFSIGVVGALAAFLLIALFVPLMTWPPTRARGRSSRRSSSPSSAR